MTKLPFDSSSASGSPLEEAGAGRPAARRIDWITIGFGLLLAAEIALAIYVIKDIRNVVWYRKNGVHETRDHRY